MSCPRLFRRDGGLNETNPLRDWRSHCGGWVAKFPLTSGLLKTLIAPEETACKGMQKHRTCCSFG
jgi:hypothetical protein